MIEEKIKDSVIVAIQDLYGQVIDSTHISLQETRKEFEGQITVVVFPLTKFSKKSPEQTASELGNYLQQHLTEVAAFNVLKGFLNIVIADSFWIDFFVNAIASNDYAIFPKNGKRVIVEYSSPNTNKPLHLGHIRNNLLGFSVSELLKAAGYEVVKVNLVNDRGIHICKSMLAWQLFGNGETPYSAQLKGDHLVGKYYVLFDKAYKKQIEELVKAGHSEEDAKKNAPLIQQAQSLLQLWEAGDKKVVELWKMMNAWVYEGFDITYKKLGVDFDKFYYESDTYLLGKALVKEGLQKQVFFKKEDGSVWIDLTEEGLDQKLLLRSDGTSVYMTQDLGTAQLKFDDFAANQSIYVVGNEQDYHFKVLFLILEKLGKSWAKGLFHLSYGMVDLPTGKMKSREGTVVDADDLLQEMIDTARDHTIALGKVEHLSAEQKDGLYQQIALGALKYFLLKVEPKKRLLFDPNESIDFQGNTGPFIQYTHARICSVLDKANFGEQQLCDVLGQFTVKSAPPVHARSIGDDQVEQGTTKGLESTLATNERDLILSLYQFPQVIVNAAQAYSPAFIAQYSYELAKLYNRFYHETPILKTEDMAAKDFRLILSSVTARTLKRCLGMLGIVAPERM